MSSDKLGKHRYQTIPSELSNSLIPLVVSERSSLSFYRALCNRFGVDASGGDHEYGAIEAWLAEGRIRWDRACAAMNYDDVRLIIQESPDFLATFACARAVEGEDAEFDAFPDPIVSGSRKPQLPGKMIQPRAYRSVWTLTAPMHHGADEKHGNVNLFRRHPIFDPLTGRRAFVPFVSGNSVRGMWRDMLFGSWLQLLGLKSSQIPPEKAHAFLAGGAVENGADTATVNNEVRLQARELCPPWDLFAGCIDQQIMAGRARVSDATLVCRETAWKVHRLIAPDVDVNAFAASLPSANELTALRLGTRQKHAELLESDGVQMLFNTEHLIEGAQMVHSVQLWNIDAVSPITASCLAYLLDEFGAVATVGAGASRGFGAIAFDGYERGDEAPELPSPDEFLEYVEIHRNEAIDWIMQTPVKRSPKAKASKRRGAEAAE